MPLYSAPCAGAWSRCNWIIKDHEAFLGVGKAIIILAYHASFLGCCLFVVSLLWPAGLSEKTFEELIVLVEVFDEVGVVGSWTIHEFVEVVR